MPHPESAEYKIQARMLAKLRQYGDSVEMPVSFEEQSESLPEVVGKYLVSSGSTSTDLQFEADYVSAYAAAVEQDFIELGKQELCGTKSEELNIQITFLELSFFEKFDFALVPRYGRADYHKTTNTLSGLFVWNPRQILADQYWLHTGEKASHVDEQIGEEYFESSAATYYQNTKDRRRGDPAIEFPSIQNDLEWYFKEIRRSPRASMFSTIARSDLDYMFERAAPGYAALATKIVRIRMKSEELAVDSTLESVHDASVLSMYKVPPTEYLPSKAP